MSLPDTKPTLAHVLDLAISGAMDEVRVALPGRVTAYNSSTQRVDVQPLVKDGFEAEDGTRQTTRLPVIPDVPVVFPGSGAFRVTFPISVGDNILLVFSSSSIARWKASGGEVDPGDDRHHQLSDAVAIPGLQASPATNASTTNMELHSTTLIVAGGNNPLVTKAEFDAHIHPAPGGATSPPSIPSVGTAKLRG